LIAGNGWRITGSRFDREGTNSVLASSPDENGGSFIITALKYGRERDSSPKEHEGEGAISML
jgi:hypothetical protein